MSQFTIRKRKRKRHTKQRGVISHGRSLYPKRPKKGYPLSEGILKITLT